MNFPAAEQIPFSRIPFLIFLSISRKRRLCNFLMLHEIKYLFLDIMKGPKGPTFSRLPSFSLLNGLGVVQRQKKKDAKRERKGHKYFLLRLSTISKELMKRNYVQRGAKRLVVFLPFFLWIYCQSFWPFSVHKPLWNDQTRI